VKKIEERGQHPGQGGRPFLSTPRKITVAQKEVVEKTCQIGNWRSLSRLSHSYTTKRGTYEDAAVSL